MINDTVVLVLQFAIMVTYSRRGWRGLTELGQESREIAAGEGPLKGLDRGDAVT